MTIREREQFRAVTGEGSHVLPFSRLAPGSPSLGHASTRDDLRRMPLDSVLGGVASLAWAALDFSQAPSVAALFEDFSARIGDVVDAGNCRVLFVEQGGGDSTTWELTGYESGGEQSVVGISLNLLLQSRPHLWQELVLGRHVEICADTREGEPRRTDEALLSDLSSYLLLAPLGAGRDLCAVLCLEVPHGKPKPSPVQLLHLRQLCQQIAVPLVRLTELERVREDNEALRNENAALRGGSSRRRAAELEVADAQMEIKQRVFDNFAHDLGTPTVAIRGYSRMLLEGRAGSITDTQRKFLATIASNASRLAGLVHAMGYPVFSEPLDLDSFDIVELWRECRFLVEGQITTESVTIEEVLPDRPCYVTADRRKTADLIMKLLSNSLKFTSESGRLRVSIRPNARGEIVMRFSDTGVGLEPDVLEKLFNYEIAKPSVPNAGAGHDLGLAVVRDVARAQGGRITARADEDTGPTFEFTLVSTESIYRDEPEQHQDKDN